MVDILHRVGIKAPLAKVYESVATREGLAGWWTNDTRGVSKVGEILNFHFTKGDEEIGRFDMKVLELVPNQRVRWEVVGGMGEWIGTKMHFELKVEGEYVIVLFKHGDWKEPSEGMHHCTTKWAIFMMSLKLLCESGKGSPSPNDVKIDNWN
jgi:hypothetical protein